MLDEHQKLANNRVLGHIKSRAIVVAHRAASEVVTPDESETMLNNGVEIQKVIM